MRKILLIISLWISLFFMIEDTFSFSYGGTASPVAPRFTFSWNLYTASALGTWPSPIYRTYTDGYFSNVYDMAYMDIIVWDLTTKTGSFAPTLVDVNSDTENIGIFYLSWAFLHYSIYTAVVPYTLIYHTSHYIEALDIPNLADYNAWWLRPKKIAFLVKENYVSIQPLVWSSTTHLWLVGLGHVTNTASFEEIRFFTSESPGLLLSYNYSALGGLCRVFPSQNPNACPAWSVLPWFAISSTWSFLRTTWASTGTLADLRWSWNLGSIYEQAWIYGDQTTNISNPIRSFSDFFPEFNSWTIAFYNSTGGTYTIYNSDGSSNTGSTNTGSTTSSGISWPDFSSCSTFEIWCYVSETFSWLIWDYIPDFDFSSTFNSCSTGSTSSWWTVSEKLWRLISIINPIPPDEWVLICGLFWTWILDYSQASQSWNIFSIYAHGQVPEILEWDGIVAYGQNILDIVMIIWVFILIFRPRKND